MTPTTARYTMRMRLLRAFLFLVAATYGIRAAAQEVDCTVQVNYEAIPTTNKDLLRDFAADLKGYLNNYNWGPESGGEKVKCTIDIFISSVIGEDRYSAQVFVGSQRPIFKAGQNTAVTRIFDELWEFTYVRNRPLNHNPHTYNDLTSFLDFYMYLIVGYDFDTYDKLSGTPLFQKAADVASIGRSSGQKGWQQSSTSYSRIQLIEELLNPSYEPIRTASWTYHICGLDSLALSKPRAYANLISAIQSIAALRKRVDTRSLTLKTFFDVKAKEIAEVFLEYPDPGVYQLLSNADPQHLRVYDEARQKRNK
jgi:hypothetical protein